MLKIREQCFISELGKRANNEDNYGLIKGSVYVVCDGVGGAEKGEIASQIVVSAFINAYQADPNASVASVMQLAQHQLTEFLNEHPEAAGMATTLTFSNITSKGVQVAWVGDSRVYQFRKGRIVFVTQDHSWVNDALKAGIISAEEAIGHPKSNIITRAIQGLHKPIVADTVLLTDVQKGDYFLHCSDGVLEAWSDEDLAALFGSLGNCREIIERIKRECLKESKDNFTAIVYQIEEGTKAEPLVNKTGKDERKNNSKNIWKKLFWVAICVIIFLLAKMLSVKPFEAILGKEKDTTGEASPQNLKHTPSIKSNIK